MINDLITRLETATKGSRELDVRIHAALHPDHPIMTDTGGYGADEHPVQYTPLSEMIEPWARNAPDEKNLRHHHWDGLAMSAGVPLYSTSIDAALTLLKEGWWWEKSIDGVITVGSSPYTIDQSFNGCGRTTELSFCIAALKARRPVE